MLRSRFRIIILLALVVLTAVVLILARPVREWFARTALSAAFEDELNYTSREKAGTDPFAPVALGESILDRLLPRRGWSSRYHEQARYLIDGPFVNLHLQGGRIVGDVRAALAGLPHLRDVHISTDSSDGIVSISDMTEDDLKHLCGALHALPRLETLRLHGGAVADDPIAPLAGHPTLRWLDLSGAPPRRITAKSAETFRRMPALATLWLGAVDRRSLEAIVAAIPQVNIRMEPGPSNQRAGP
jgi:hypothetical protein